MNNRTGSFAPAVIVGVLTPVLYLVIGYKLADARNDGIILITPIDIGVAILLGIVAACVVRIVQGRRQRSTNDSTRVDS